MDAENIINSDDIDLNNHREEISSALDSIASWADLVSSLTRGIIDSDNDREREVLARSIESTISILGATADDLNQRILSRECLSKRASSIGSQTSRRTTAKSQAEKKEPGQQQKPRRRRCLGVLRASLDADCRRVRVLTHLPECRYG